MENPGHAQILDTQKRDVVVAVNPNAGASATEGAAEKLRNLLENRGFRVIVESDLQQLEKITSKPQRLRCVVAAGGDGTIALLANRLAPETVFAILPQGTENLLAKHLEIPSSPEGVAGLIDTGRYVAMDAGRANGHLFLVMASCGFDAEVVHQLHKSRRGHIRYWAYAKPIFDAIRKYRYPMISVTCDEHKKIIRGKWAFVFNVPRYAMNLRIAERADETDGLLDLCTFKSGNLFKGLVYLFGVLTRQHHRWSSIQLVQAKKIRLESSKPVPYQLDGDPGGHLPLDIEVMPKRLRVLTAKEIGPK